MKFNIRILNDTDYEEILIGWWKDWGFVPVERDFLSDLGLIVYDGDIPVCAGFVYATNSSVSLVNWIISNKDYRKKPNRSEALDFLIYKLTEVCKQSGFKYIFVNNNNSNLISRFQKQGYSVGVKNSTELILKI
jgi:hypothetical protein